MTLSEYIQIIKPNMRESVSNEDLMNLLFSDIIRKANLKGKDGDFYQFDASRSSRILSGKLPINKDIIDTLNKDAVIESLPAYFSNTLLPRLSNKEGLLYTLQKAINKDANISHSEKVTYQMLLNISSLHIVLARLLIESINDSKKPRTSPLYQESNPLRLKTVEGTNNISPLLKIFPFIEPFKRDFYDLKNKIKETYARINDIICHKQSSEYLNEYVPTGLLKVMASFPSTYIPINISTNDEEKIKTYAEENSIDMSINFFNLGNLQKKQELAIAGWSTYPQENITGNPREKKKYDLINHLIDGIDTLKILKILIDNFSDYYVARFLLENVNKSSDSDITITLDVPTKSIFTIADLKGIDRCALEKIDASYDFKKLFSIHKNRKFLSYYETVDHPPVFIPPIPPIRRKTDDEFYNETWNDLFPRNYFYSEEGGQSYIQIHFDKLLQNTAVAFPTKILFKTRIDKIHYQIRSANMPDILEGELLTEEGSNNG